MLIAYNQIRDIESAEEEFERFNALIKIFNRAYGG